MTKEEIIKIIKDKDDFKNVVEIKENAKGEPSVSVKIRSDNEEANRTVDEAVTAYKHAKEELAK